MRPVRLHPPLPSRGRESRGIERRSVDERGTGAFGTVFGVLVFFSLVFFAVHVLVNLWTISTVTGVAHDAARDVAGSGIDLRDPVAFDRETSAATSRALELLGGLDAKFEWTADVVDGEVELRVTADSVRLLPRIAGSNLGFDGIDRRMVVRMEQDR